MVRLQGREAGASSDLWIGVSVLAPGGGTTLSSSAQEKMYVVLDGTLHIANGETELSLENGIPTPHCLRVRLGKKTNSPVTVLLALQLSANDRRRTCDPT